MKKLINDLLRPDEQYYRPDNDWGLPWLLMSGMTPSETRGLLAKLLEHNTDGIRLFANSHLRDLPQKINFHEIAQQVSSAEMCQMLLTVTNESLVNVVEQMIADGEIRIGKTETRDPLRIRHGEGGYFKTKPQISRLGVRFKPQKDVASLRLRAFIMELYGGESEKELAWLLRDQPGDTNVVRLDNYLRTATPEQVLTRLVMSSRDRVLDSFRLLRYGHFELPSNPEGDKGLVEKILWKLGGDLSAPPSPERRVVDRIKIFRRVSENEAARSEEGIDAIRSAGMNMFVAFEELLSDVVDYTCWALFSDHYSDNRRMRFVYRHHIAQEFSRPLLSGREDFEFDAGGENALGTLITALREIGKIGDEILESSHSFTEREDRVPFAVAYSGIYSFPFLHTKLILDAEPSSARATLNALRNATSELESCGVAKVRNGMGHPRSSFPTDEEVGKCCLGVERALSILQAQGAVTTIYVRAGRETDSFGRTSTKMADGEGKMITLYGPSESARSGMPSHQIPQLIFTGLHLPDSSEPLRLSYVEETEFTKILDMYAPLRPGSSIAELESTTESNKSANDVF